MTDNRQINIPDHIPPEWVLDFDMFNDPLLADNLHDGVARLAAEGRDLFYTGRNGGHWVAIGRDAIFEIATHVDVFSNSPLHHPYMAHETIQIPIGLDPPEHGIYRKVLNDAFSARAMSAMEPEIRALTTSLIDDVLAEGGCDFAKAVAEPLPVRIFMRMMGFPLDRFVEFREWVLAGISEGDPAKRQIIWDRILGMSAELIRDRQAKRQDDLISRLLDADVGGRPPNFEEMQSLCLMLFIAGLDTVVNGMSLIVRHLATDAELQATLRAEPKRIPSAVEEILRRYTFTTPPRFLAADTSFRGAPLRKGDLLILYLPAADLDPRGFEAPLKVDLERKTPHLAFGAGPHRCVGAQLARIELRILLEEWLKRVPPFELDAEHPWKFHGGFVYSIDSLPLRWSARVGLTNAQQPTAA